MMEDDDLEEVGRPEGPLEELHVDPYAWEPESDRAPEMPLADPSDERPASRREPLRAAVTRDEDEEDEEAEARRHVAQDEARASAAIAEEELEAPRGERSARPPRDAGVRHETPRTAPPSSFGRRRSRRG